MFAAQDIEFFGHLEMHMRQELPPLCGRDHLAYRSAYFPVKVRLHALSVLVPLRARLLSVAAVPA